MPAAISVVGIFLFLQTIHVSFRICGVRTIKILYYNHMKELETTEDTEK
jgi:hypothetical protein